LPHSIAIPANTKVCEYTAGGGAGWDCAVTSFTANTVTRNGVTALSPWAVGDLVGPTAITLDSITVHSNSSGASVLLIAVMLLAGGILVFSWARRKVYTK
jgi:hypothetical protein